MIFLIGGLSFLVQILCILHAIRTGRNQIWIWIILLGSMLGCTAYFAFEIMPELFGPSSPRARANQMATDREPILRLRRAEKQLAIADTAANHTDIADAYHDMGAFDSAAQHYRTALDRLHRTDELIETKLAHSLFSGGKYADALAAADKIKLRPGSRKEDQLTFLKARALSAVGQKEAARSLFARTVGRIHDAENSGHYAALLIEMGDTAEAAIVLGDIKAISVAMRPEERLRLSDLLRWVDDQLTRVIR